MAYNWYIIFVNSRNVNNHNLDKVHRGTILLVLQPAYSWPFLLVQEFPRMLYLSLASIVFPPARAQKTDGQFQDHKDFAS